MQLEGFTLESAEPAVLQQAGRGGVRIELAGRNSRWLHHAWIRCSPAAAAVAFERGGDVRRVAVGDLALWIGVAWTDETEPIVRALGAPAMSGRYSAGRSAGAAAPVATIRAPAGIHAVLQTGADLASV